MVATEHHFVTEISWNTSTESSQRRNYSRAHTISSPGVPSIQGSAARVFHGDADRWNPEQMLLAAVSQCHMMTFLFLAKQANLEIASYSGRAEGTLTMDPDGIGGEFSQITLFPHVEVVTGDTSVSEEVNRIHGKVHEYCFIARSIRVEITVEPETSLVSPPKL